jgi:hypothetical protein
MRARIVVAHDRMQHGYRYTCVCPKGKQFDPRFTPDLTPKEMLTLGVFGGVYMRDCGKEFPSSWFRGAKFQKPGIYRQDPALNLFKVKASQPLSEWKRKGWIHRDDPRGWFQWYCRYYMGRRLKDEDERQIKRWKAIRRHIGGLKTACRAGDINCRPRQRQALLHWSYDSRKI